MVAETRIYAEGGGDGKDGKGFLRQDFSAFLKGLVDIARSKRIQWAIIVCGPRNAAFGNFMTASRTHRQAFNVLLVDSEGPVRSNPWNHLRDRDGWDSSGAPDNQCHLMVQIITLVQISALNRARAEGRSAWRTG